MKIKPKKEQAKKPEKMNWPKSEPVTLPVEQLTTAPWNPRGEITPESVADLIPSIKANGLIQPIAVVHDLLSEADDVHYIVCAGNRRLVACREIG